MNVPSQRFDIEGKVVLITGPARGIGAEAARQLSARGARLALVGLEPERLEQLASELSAQTLWYEADVRSLPALESAVALAVERFGGIDVAIANAGIAPVGTVETMPPEEFEAVIQVDLLGVWRTLRASLPHVRDRRGYLLSIASLAALIHLPLMSAYAAAKAGVAAMADVLRMELEGTGTKVGVAYFGFIDTDMTRGALRDPLVQEVRRGWGRRLLPPPLPVEVAGAAIVDGIERRRRSIVVPKSAMAALATPNLSQRVAEVGTRRAGFADLIRREQASPPPPDA
jgi:NAD(P)-dependent dehydrogenase (short-subunit alcohol dehydrogenase family)